MDPFPGTCFRCGSPGHWAGSQSCPWLIKAGSRSEHEKRIDSLRDRFTGFRITGWQKSEYIRHENKLWYDGKVPSRLRSNS